MGVPMAMILVIVIVRIVFMGGGHKDFPLNMSKLHNL
uniref:Uncharacterized protein n=1 Tax=Curvibacter symbiont subsp. Hydra magnipapillata TaxID=667019 RepID=C9YBF5_CURXX|nr:hypothetical protein Csp_A14560 [Curvibacter putative symbiont of Hydra magnipapillata]